MAALSILDVFALVVWQCLKTCAATLSFLLTAFQLLSLILERLLVSLIERKIDMKTWNFGIVGAGLIADFHARAIGDMPNAKLIGCCDKIADRAKKLADKYDVRAFEDYGTL